MPSLRQTFKQGETRPFRVTLRRSKKIVNLYGVVEVRFRSRPGVPGQGELIDQPAVVLQTGPSLTPTNKGRVEYQWRDIDVDTPGVFRAEFVATWGDGTIEKFPNTENYDYEIVPAVI